RRRGDAYLVPLLLDRRQRYAEVVGIRDVVETDDGQVIRDVQAQPFGDVDDLKCNVIVANEDRFGSPGRREKGAQHAFVVLFDLWLARRPGEQAPHSGADQVRIERQSILLDRPAIAGVPLDDARRAEVVGGDEADAAITELDQVLDRQKSTADVVHGDG